MDQLDRHTTYAYDAVGDLTATTRLAGTSDATSITAAYQTVVNYFQDRSVRTAITDPLGHTTNLTYNDNLTTRALTSVIDPLGHSTVFTPGPNGLPTAIATAAGQTRVDYDAGTLSAVTTPMGHLSRRVIDGAGRPALSINALGQSTGAEYDAANHMLRSTDPLQGETRLSYDENGNLLTVTDPRNGVTQYAYDVMDRVKSRTDPLLRVERRRYDGNGNLLEVTDRASQITWYDYDGLNRRVRAYFPDGPGMPRTLRRATILRCA